MKRTWQRSSIGARQMLAEISLTPFIGVLQAVVVICMFALPMATHKLEAHVGFGGCGMGYVDPPVPIRLAIKQTGETYLDGVAVNRAELKASLAVMAARPNPPQLNIVAERSASYEDFVTVLTTAKIAGLNVQPDIE